MITKIALMILAIKKLDVSLPLTKRTEINVANTVKKIANVLLGELTTNLQTNVNCHTVIPTQEAVTEKLVHKLKNAKKLTNVKLQMIVQLLNLDLLAVSTMVKRNVANTNVELIPIAFLETIKNGDIAERIQVDKTNVSTNQNVKEMKVVMTRTHVLEISV